MEPLKSFKNNISEEILMHALDLSGPEAVFFAKYQAKIIAELLKKMGNNPARILDYGCGDGTMAYLMQALLPNANIQGIDTSKELIEIAQEWYGVKNDKLSFDTKMEDQYDLVYIANVLHHIPQGERASLLQELTTHLTPHGILIVLEFNPFNPLEVWRFYRNKEERGNHMILPHSLRKLFSNANKTRVYYFSKVYALVKAN